MRFLRLAGVIGALLSGCASIEGRFEGPMLVDSAVIYLDGGSIEIRGKLTGQGFTILLDRSIDGKGGLAVTLQGRHLDVKGTESGQVFSALSAWLAKDENGSSLQSDNHAAVRGFFEQICWSPSGANLGSTNCSDYFPNRKPEA